MLVGSLISIHLRVYSTHHAESTIFKQLETGLRLFLCHTGQMVTIHNLRDFGHI